MNSDNFTHTDPEGNARMVDVSDKADQLRIAKATGHIRLSAETLKLIRENQVKKGDVLKVAEFAGIQAAKRTAELIPLCHNIPLSKVLVVATPFEQGVMVECEVRCVGKTGVEMEALTGVTVALLTIYDMCKAVDKLMVIENVQLLEKTKKDIL